MRAFAPIMALMALLSACSGSSPSASPQPAPSNIRLSGKVLERLVEPPYNYLRLETEAGQVWTAVPISSIDPGAQVTVENGVGMWDYESRLLGRKFDYLVFGTLKHGR